MSAPTLADGARIGPNAVLQLLPVLDRSLGREARRALLAQAQVPEPAPDAGMLPEAEVARLHRALRQSLPDRAAALAHEAGSGTGDYILANRIPGLAKALIRALPRWAGARVLTAAIGRHAWTFVGSGRFRVASHAPLTFEIAGNPLIAGEVSGTPVCHWHSAVFERLFASLVWPGATVVETCCAACGAPACRFEIRPEG